MTSTMQPTAERATGTPGALRVTITRSALLDALQRAGSTVATKAATLPVLASVRLTVAPERFMVEGTDMERWASAEAPCHATAAGAICLPAARLLALVQGLASDATVAMDLSPTNAKAVITAGRTRAALVGLPADEFPTAPTLDAAALGAVGGGTVLSAMQRVAHAASSEASRPIENAICLRGAADGLWALATDRHRVAAVRITRQAPFQGEYLVPHQALPALAKTFGEEEEVRLAAGSNQLRLEAAGRAMQLRMVTGPYYDIARVVPRVQPSGAQGKLTHRVIVDRALLLATIKRLRAAGEEAFKKARLTVREGEITIAGRTPDIGEITDAVAAKFEPIPEAADAAPLPEFQIRLDGDYLTDALQFVGGDAVRIEVDGTNAERPIILSAPEDASDVLDRDRWALVMPIRLPLEG